MRTVQTANIINKFHNVKVIKDPLLIEIDQGIFTGRYKNSYTEEENKLRFNRDANCGMESYQSVAKRTIQFIEQLSKYKFKNIFIITHNCNASILENLLKNIEIDYSNPNHLRCFKNAEVKNITYK